MPRNFRYAFGNAVFMFLKECISDSFYFCTVIRFIFVIFACYKKDRHEYSCF